MALKKVSADDELFIIRVFLPTGYTVTLNVYGSDKFSKIRDECWKKESQSWECNKNDARFRLYTTEYYFYDNDTISKLVSLYPSFEDLGTIVRYSLLLETPKMKYDALIRKNMKAENKKPIFWKGYLLKCSKPTGRGFWQKRFFVLQSQTLLWFSNQDKFLKGNKAEKYIPLGGSILPNLKHSSANHSKKYSFVLEIPTTIIKSNKAKVFVLAAESNEKKKSFIDTLYKCVFYRQSSIILNIIPTLYPYFNEEGIFRIAGESSEISKLQDMIDQGNIPDFRKYCNKKTYDNLTGLLKRQLRYNNDPLIPYPFYEPIIDIGKRNDLIIKKKQLNQVVKQLPQTNLLLLSQLMLFLKECSKYSQKSKMDSKNLSIVIGPNILRSKDEVSNPMKALEDSKHMQSVVESMIEYANDIFPSLNQLYMHDKTTNPNYKYGIVSQKNNNNNNNNYSGVNIFDFRDNIKPSKNKNNSSKKNISSPKKKQNNNENIYKLQNAPTLSLTKKQQDNERILQLCTHFEDTMGQSDEIIDYQQEFTESLLSQITEKAENSGIVNSNAFMNKLDSSFKTVINAAKKHAEVLTKLNQQLQMIYSEIEDAIDLAKGKNVANATPGGDNAGYNEGNNERDLNEQDLNSQLYEEENKQNNNNYYDNNAANNGASNAANNAANGGSGYGYYNYNSNSNKNPPGTTVAKAMFDYPGGYRSNELTFHRGTTLIVTKVKEGWAYGYYELEPSMNGWFPKSYVKEIEQ